MNPDVRDSKDGPTSQRIASQQGVSRRRRPDRRAWVPPGDKETFLTERGDATFLPTGRSRRSATPISGRRARRSMTGSVRPRFSILTQVLAFVFVIAGLGAALSGLSTRGADRIILLALAILFCPGWLGLDLWMVIFGHGGRESSSVILPPRLSLDCAHGPGVVGSPGWRSSRCSCNPRLGTRPQRLSREDSSELEGAARRELADKRPSSPQPC